ncbi:hypothetical protein JR316_0000925 [Psilocybe cubensis]|uniref:Uncharacterized protein n=1 Tax=Psilocybe cubensis TaxID=181762 RepID=A0ACB8HI47_PSICU|nr:hypothetical protein JR316_0000925 [Psilocybe cubensis]KAH9486860.1 hypothetical protein JR316_0000925 [Psilocybe cubensis]
MPTCTLPFEILLEFVNDTEESSTLHLTRGGDDTFSANATILLQPSESISLVLNAGSIYQYILKQKNRKGHVSVRVWKDVRITATDVFVRKTYNLSPGMPALPSQGITVVCQTG